MERKVASHHQPEKVTKHLETAAVSHGAAGTIDLGNVTIDKASLEPHEVRAHCRKRAIRFCSSTLLDVRLDKPGDGNHISGPVTLDLQGVHLPKDSGPYDIRGLEFESNGRVHLKVTERTRFVPREKQPHHVNQQLIGCSQH